MSNFRSGFEVRVAKALKAKKIKFKFEPEKFQYVQPQRWRHYTPDFLLSASGCYVECKGRLTKEDRDKLLWVKEQYPDLRLVLLFDKSDNTIRKGSKTTYSDWAIKHGFEWADFRKDGIPKKWLTNGEQK